MDLFWKQIIYLIDRNRQKQNFISYTLQMNSNGSIVMIISHHFIQLPHTMPIIIYYYHFIHMMNEDGFIWSNKISFHIFLAFQCFCSPTIDLESERFTLERHITVFWKAKWNNKWTWKYEFFLCNWKSVLNRASSHSGQVVRDQVYYFNWIKWSLKCLVSYFGLEEFKKEPFYVSLIPISILFEMFMWFHTRNAKHCLIFCSSLPGLFFRLFFFISLTIAIWMICWPFHASYSNSWYVTNRINFSLTIQIGFPLIP